MKMWNKQVAKPGGEMAKTPDVMKPGASSMAMHMKAPGGKAGGVMAGDMSPVMKMGKGHGPCC